MIVSCPCGKKKFNLDISLIPEEGRLLQCGTCDHKWHYSLPLDTKDSNANISSNVSESKIDNDYVSNEVETKNDIVNEIKQSINNNSIEKKQNHTSILSILSLSIVSFLALIILLDTFKHQIEIIIPNFNSYLTNLYVTINDIYLFVIDLIR
ncbi:MAG: zinc-ribbon domain-containing protein [Candidatus Pelagibacter sp.]